MATLIIQGNTEEGKKILNVLKNSFDVANKRATVSTAEGAMTVVDVFEEKFDKGEFSNEEILKALYCCSHIDRKCGECPFKKVSDCEKRVLADGATVVRRIMCNS